MKTYIHVNQHKIRANKKHGTNELTMSSLLNKVVEIHIVMPLKYWVIALFVMVVTINLFCLVVRELLLKLMQM